jgi:hypothetical protein
MGARRDSRALQRVMTVPNLMPSQEQKQDQQQQPQQQPQPQSTSNNEDRLPRRTQSIDSLANKQVPNKYASVWLSLPGSACHYLLTGCLYVCDTD